MDWTDGLDWMDGCDGMDRVDGVDGMDRTDGCDGLDRMDRTDGCDRMDGVDRTDGGYGSDWIHRSDRSHRRLGSDGSDWVYGRSESRPWNCGDYDLGTHDDGNNRCDPVQYEHCRRDPSSVLANRLPVAIGSRVCELHLPGSPGWIHWDLHGRDCPHSPHNKRDVCRLLYI